MRDQTIAVLATTPPAVHQALLFYQLSDNVTLLLHTTPALADEELAKLAARGVAVVAGDVERVAVEDDRLVGVRLGSGRVVPAAALVVATFFRARADFLSGLGLEPTPMLIGEQFWLS